MPTVRVSLPPAVRAHFEGSLPLGEAVRVRLVDADLQKRRVMFRPSVTV